MTTPLVLLPGMMCDARLFAPQTAALSGRRVLHHAPLTDHDSTRALAAGVLAHAPPRFALAGLSMGGIVAMEIAAQAPERLAGIALLDTNPLAEAPERRAARAVQMDRVRDGRLEEIMRRELTPRYLCEGPARGVIQALCVEMALSLGPDIFCRQSAALRDRRDRRDALRALGVPTLILCGRHDVLAPVARHELMHGLVPHARLVVVEDAAHLPTLEAPETTNAALERWLDHV